MLGYFEWIFKCFHANIISMMPLPLQFLSREPRLDDAVIQKFQAKVTELKLNPEGAKYEVVSHGNCTYTGH